MLPYCFAGARIIHTVSSIQTRLNPGAVPRALAGRSLPALSPPDSGRFSLLFLMASSPSGDYLFLSLGVRTAQYTVLLQFSAHSSTRRST